MERGAHGGGGFNVGSRHVKDGWYAPWQAARRWGLWDRAEGAGNMFGQQEDTGTEHVVTWNVWMGRGGSPWVRSVCVNVDGRASLW